MTQTAPMTLGKNGRLYACRFDHAEAIERHAAGESIRELADAYGVTWNAMQRVVVPGIAERQLDAQKRWRTGSCEDCGGPAMRLVGSKASHNHDGRVLCMECSAKRRRTAVRFDRDGHLVEVKCMTCKEWLAPASFPKGTRYRDLRDGGFHNACRPCQTILRQAHRDARKVPCVRCGAPRLTASESNTLRLGNNDSGLCAACYHATREPKTHCVHGHARTPDNVTSAGSCRECGRIRERARRRKPAA